ncbi:hypothetical protein CDD83_8801 [Cordyceps sp. RAO-2017]|nr:hypothetical protein CDD83_8801 [Cordyceps sp. RAO-2017]
MSTDALCIIQDSKEDWQTDSSSRMADISQGAQVTNAASSSHSCGVHYVLKVAAGERAGAIDHDGRRRQKRPLILLERMPQLYKMRVPGPRYRSGNRGTFDKALGEAGDEGTAASQSSTDPRTGDPLLTWQRGIGDYTLYLSATHLLSDRLPALSVIATLVQRRSGWTYLGGLRRETFLNDLQWEGLDGLGRVSRAEFLLGLSRAVFASSIPRERTFLQVLCKGPRGRLHP